MRRTDNSERDSCRHLLEQVKAEVKATSGATGRSFLAQQVLESIANTPRHKFVPRDVRHYAYENRPLPIGYGQTISQPYMVALMTDLLNPGPDDVILEIGTGSGYQTAVLSSLVRQIYSLEIIPELSKRTTAKFRKMGISNVETRVGDGYDGWPEHGPYDGIIVTAAAREVPPPLLEQLKPGRRLVIPVGAPLLGQELTVIEKDESGRPSVRNVLPVAFVPLVRAEN